MNKLVIYGGGTFNKAKCHLALATPAFGTTAKQLAVIFKDRGYEVDLRLTKMADSSSNIVTNSDLFYDLLELLKDRNVKVIIFNAAVCDFYLGNLPEEERLNSENNHFDIVLSPEGCKFIKMIKDTRPDIFVVGFKTTSNQTTAVQERLSHKQIEKSGVDIVFANDVSTRSNLIIVKKGGIYHNDRDKLLGMLPTLIEGNSSAGNVFEVFKCYR